MDDHENQLALQRHIYKNFLYTAYWRDRSIQTKDTDDLCKDMEFPTHLRVPAYLSDFEYVPFAERTIQFGVLEKRLPPYVFKKNLEQYYPVQRGLLSSLFNTPGADFKYGPNDSNLLLGSRSPKALIELVKLFGFQLHSTPAEIIGAINVDKYFAVVDDLHVHSMDIEDILEMIFISGIDLVEDFTVKSTKLQSVPVDKRKVKIENEEVVLPSYICQCKISFENILLTSRIKNSTRLLVLGAQSLQDLLELSSACKIHIEEETTPNDQPTVRDRIPDDVQIFVWRRDQGRCVKCGSQINLEFDHIIPVSKGGSNTARNVQLLCQDCNRRKGNIIGG